LGWWYKNEEERFKINRYKNVIWDKLDKIEIMHNGISYILSISKDNKLVLTK